MQDDLARLLEGFPYEPGRVVARLVRCADGRTVLQVRLELGVLQMETSGRPDGRPSLVEDPAPAPAGRWSPDFAAAVRLEVVQFEQRAVAFLAVGEPVAAVCDAEAALARLELLAGHGPEEEGEWAIARRFSVLVLRTRAASAAAIRDARPRDAAGAIDTGLALLREAAAEAGIGDAFEKLADVRALRAMRDSLLPALPPAERAELEARIRAAIARENYELAAILRDELRRLR